MSRSLWLVALVVGSPHLTFAQSNPTIVPPPYSVVDSSTSVSSSRDKIPTTLIRDILRQAKQQLAVNRLPKLEPAEKQLSESLKQLEQFIVVDSPNGKQWSQFLNLGELKRQLASDKPSYVRLLELEMNMRQNYLGLEYPQFVQLRDALRSYSYAARFHGQEDRFIKFISDEIDDVVKKLEDPAVHNQDLITDLVTIAANLHQSNQAEASLRRLRDTYRSENVRVIVNENLIGRLVARPVAQPQTVDENILGTQICGTAFMDGNVSANILPMTNGVSMQLDLSACLTSQSRGYNRGVVFNSTSSSPVLASKQLFISLNGVSTGPTTISTQLTSQIHSIEHRSRIVRKIAKRKSAEQKPQTDAIAESRMQTRVCNQFTEQVEQQVGQAQPRLAELRGRTVPELRRVGFRRPEMSLNSTSSTVLVGTVLAEHFQLASAGVCPIPQPLNAGVVGQVHQSALNNCLATVLAGRTIRSESLGEYVKQVTGKVPDELKDEIEGEPWSITLNPTEPVRVSFAADRLNITVRIVRMTRGKQNLTEALSVTTSYVPALVSGRLTLTREGEVTVVSDKETRGAQATALRSFLKNKFDKTFPPSLASQQFSLSNLQSRFPQASKLGLDVNRTQMRLDSGWLQIALML